jgi:MFS family permease
MMEQQMDLKQLERKVWTSFHSDGLGDIFLGCVILMFALAPLLTDIGFGDFWSAFLFLLFWALVYVLLVLLRKHFVIPRTGLVRFGQMRKKRLANFNIIMFIILFMSLILGILSLRASMTQAWVHNIRFMAVVLIGFGLAGYFLGFVRLYIYGILVALSIPIGEWLYSHAGVPHHGYPVTFGFTSAVLIITGITLFMRLLKKIRGYKRVDLSVETQIGGI